MLSETDLRQLARQALDAGVIPNRPPDRTWGVPGIGGPCIICQDRVAAGEMANELHFMRAGVAKLDKFQAHLRCATVLGLVRNSQPTGTKAAKRTKPAKRTEAEAGEIVSLGADPATGNRTPFTLCGSITRWSPATRELAILDRDVHMAPRVALTGLAVGLRIVAAGYHDPATGQMVVTRFASLA